MRKRWEGMETERAGINEIKKMGRKDTSKWKNEQGDEQQSRHKKEALVLPVIPE